MKKKNDHEQERRCRVCGCTDDDCRGCIERTGKPCSWVEDDLCSACVDEEEKAKTRREEIMEFTIEREVFCEGLRKTLGIVERKVTVPILGNILIAATGDAIRITATDREIVLTIEYQASVVKEGSFTIPARKIYETVRELEGETVHLVVGSDCQATVTCNKVVCKLLGLPAEEFPAAAGQSALLPLCGIKGPLLAGMIDRVHFAISTDDTRRNIEGLFAEVLRTGGPLTPDDPITAALVMVATDGHRLALVKSDITDQEKDCGKILNLPPKGMIVPRKGVNELRRLLEGDVDAVFLGVDDKTNRFIAENQKGAELTINLLGGSFPDYRRVIPEKADGDVVVTVEKSTFLRSLRRMAVIAPEAVSLAISTDLVVLQSVNADVGEIRDEIPVVTKGSDLVTKFNVRYLQDAVEAIVGDAVELRIPESRNSVVIRDSGSDGYLCIVMMIKS